MKYLLVTIISVSFLSACGPNADEQKAAAEKLANDSIAQYDSMAKVAAEMEAMTTMPVDSNSVVQVDSLESK
nr:hypothetical protein [Bacteroidota bacterium]